MAKKPASPTNGGERERKSYLTDDKRKAAAARISAERRSYQVDVVRYLQANHQKAGYAGSFVPVWPEDYDACVEKIKRLYAPADAAVIVENLTV